MRFPMLLAAGLLASASACLPYARYPDGAYQNQYLTRDAVTATGQRLLLREDRATAELVVLQPRELQGQVVVVDPDQPQGDVLVVRPAQGYDRGYARHDRDHGYDRR